MCSEENLKSLTSLIPKGGQIVITIERSTIGAANTEWLSYILEINGEIVQRGKGSSDIAETPSSPGGDWWNLDIFILDQPIDSTANFYVVDSLQKKRYEFYIEKK